MVNRWNCLVRLGGVCFAMSGFVPVEGWGRFYIIHHYLCVEYRRVYCDLRLELSILWNFL